MRLPLPALLAAASLLFAGCTTPDDRDPSGDGHGDGMMMGAHTYSMRLSGMPSGPMAPGHAFNVTVEAHMGAGMGMMQRPSDHIGAHFWNRSLEEPTPAVGESVSCSHSAGDLPGTYTAVCTAPAQPGTYHIRAHARIMANGTTHHWWGDEAMFTVA